MSQEYFSATYAESREKFLNSAGQVAARISSVVHPVLRGRSDEELAIDVAAFGAEDAPNMLFVVTGTHGLEGYPGAASMLQLMESGKLTNLPGDTGVVLLHGHNPFGWSHDSQLNEDMVDINRNFIDHSQAPGCDHEVYTAIANLNYPKRMSWSGMNALVAEYFAIAEKFGNQRFMNAVGGQYEFPSAIKYGGDAAVWSNTELRKIVSNYLGHAKKIAYLDWHTGIGDYGKLFEICPFGRDSKEREFSYKLWGEQRVDRAEQGWTSDPDKPPMPFPQELQGLTVNAVLEGAPNALVGGGVVEFGTVPLDMIVMGTLLDRWAMGRREQGDKNLGIWRALMRTLFSPRDPEWQESCLKEAAILYQQMLNGLTA